MFVYVCMCVSFRLCVGFVCVFAYVCMCTRARACVCVCVCLCVCVRALLCARALAQATVGGREGGREGVGMGKGGHHWLLTYAAAVERPEKATSYAGGWMGVYGWMCVDV